MKGPMKFFLPLIIFFCALAQAVTPDTILINPGEKIEISIGWPVQVALTHTSDESLTIGDVVEILVMVDMRCESIKLGKVKAIRVLAQGGRFAVLDEICSDGPIALNGKMVQGVNR